MKSRLVLTNALSEFKENEIIIANKLYKEKLSEKISEVAYYKALQRMCESGKIVKIAKGTYHLPKFGKYGLIPPSENEIISAFTENKTGIVTGYFLYNSLNLTTQISKTINVMSSAIDGYSKSIRNVYISKVPLEFTLEVKSIIEALEILQNFNSIQNFNYSAFVKYSRCLIKNFNNDVFNKIIIAKKYKKSTISFLKEILDYYGIKNNLNEHLSTLSNYKHPRMEEIYEIARELQ